MTLTAVLDRVAVQICYCSVYGGDCDEVLLTTPRYQNTDAKISANLRWYLANSIFRRALRSGA